ncbi:MAG: GntR family transcriptional regulator [Spirochaetaceae bacterium]|nr:GntR family transcriptional regulator [Spirochaetaceae bacterium]
MNMLPVYKSIINSISSKISSGDYIEGEKLPSESNLMTAFKTSRITVTRALKELELTGVIYREKGRGSFVSPRTASSSKIISLVIPHKADFFSGGQQYVRSVYKYCQKMGYLCSVHYSEQSSKKERAILEDVTSHQVAGIILYPIDSKNIDLISKIMIKGCPLVLLDRKLNEIELPVVESDNFNGAFNAVNYLLDKGHKRIAFVGANDAISVADRYKGYCSSLINRKIAIDRNIVFTHYINIEDDSQEILSIDEANTIIDNILTSLPKVSAIFCVNDLIAFRLMNAAGRKGVSIVDDLSFVGFDNISYPANDNIDLTSVEQNYDLIGKSCVELLCKQMEEGSGSGSSLSIPTKLKIGKSVADVNG